MLQIATDTISNGINIFSCLKNLAQIIPSIGSDTMGNAIKTTPYKPSFFFSLTNPLLRLVNTIGSLPSPVALNFSTRLSRFNLLLSMKKCAV